MADAKIQVAGLIVYFQILVFYTMVYLDWIGSRPNELSDCYSLAEDNKAYTENQLSIREQIEDLEYDRDNISEKFRFLIAFGFWVQLMNFVTETTQMFFKQESNDGDDEYIRDFQTGRYIKGKRDEKWEERKNRINRFLAWVRTVIIVLSITFFSCLVNIRSSHGGQVCSGSFLTEKELKNSDITEHYELTKGYFLKVILIFYLLIVGGIVGLLGWALYLKCYEDKVILRQQEEFNKRAEDLYGDKDIEIDLEYRPPKEKVMGSRVKITEAKDLETYIKEN